MFVQLCTLCMQLSHVLRFGCSKTCQCWSLEAPCRTCAFLPVRKMWGDGDGASLPDAHADQTLVHAADDVASAHVGVVGAIARVAAPRTKQHTIEQTGD